MKQESYNKATINTTMNLNYCGVEVCNPDFKVLPHIRQEYLLHYIISGKGHYHTSEEDYVLKDGDIFLIRPNQLVSYETDPWEPFHFTWVAFSGSEAKEIIPTLGFSDNNLVRHLHSKYSIHEKIMECIDLLESKSNYNEYMVKANLYHIFGCLSKSYLMDQPSHNSSKDHVSEHVNKAMSFIRLNYMTSITVSDVTNFVGLERSYFSKIFHKHTGKTVQEYLLEVRLQQAKLLLAQTTYSIKEIGSFIGFSDECYFSRAFKRSTGVSPSTFRKCESTNSNKF